MTSTISLPQREGEWTPEEAQAWASAQLLEGNLAGNTDTAAMALLVVKNTIQEWTDRVRGLNRRWRGTYHMLAGNTLEKGGPEDVHVPEIYKAIETLIPRVEEAILEKDPWFRVVPRRRADHRQAETLAAFIDWQFSQAKIRSLIQPAIRDSLITQSAIFYVWWDNREAMRNVRTINRTFDSDGRLKRSITSVRKRIIDYSGPRVSLVDPFDFIIDTKATNPQDALYVGHRAWLSIDEIRRIGKEMGWQNLDQLDNRTSDTIGTEQDYYRWARDPASRYGRDERMPTPVDGRPEKQEVCFLYTRLSLDGGKTFDDMRIVVASGRVVLEVRSNPYDGQFRPYATMNTNKSGHEFFGTGIFDNAIRLNQHLDRYHQTFLRGAEVAACPIVFAEEDSDLPDSLYKVRPFSVFKGVGAVRFTQIPDGFLAHAPLVLGMLQRNIEEVVGSFRLNMGQDSNGTATEATLSLQEGNRRTRGIIRAVGDGLEQLLHLFHRFNLQFSNEDVEFPVLGKRAIDLRKSNMSVGPADLLDDVHFDLVGLHSLRTYGLKATGLQSFANSMAPFIMANPTNVDQIALMHDFASELIGPEEADRYVKIPTPLDQMRSQAEENEGLITGTEIEVDPDDNHPQHKDDMRFLWERATDPKSKMHFDVRRVVVQHYLQHDALEKRQQAQDGVMEKRQQAQALLRAPEAGGQPGAEGQSPARGGVSDAMQSLSTGSPGQSQAENPGPADSKKAPRPGGTRRTMNQSDNQL